MTRVFHLQFALMLVVTTITWTLGLLVIADRRRWRDSVRSPGKLTLILFLAVSVAAIPMNWGELFKDHLPIWLRVAMLPISILSLPGVPGCAAISGWLTLRLANIHKPVSDWLELSGMVVAWIWIIYGIAAPLREYPVLQAIGVST